MRVFTDQKQQYMSQTPILAVLSDCLNGGILSHQAKSGDENILEGYMISLVII